MQRPQHQISSPDAEQLKDPQFLVLHSTVGGQALKIAKFVAAFLEARKPRVNLADAARVRRSGHQ